MPHTARHNTIQDRLRQIEKDIEDLERERYTLKTELDHIFDAFERDQQPTHWDRQRTQ